jgi:hypothetical protein
MELDPSAPVFRLRSTLSAMLGVAKIGVAFACSEEQLKEMRDHATSQR